MPNEIFEQCRDSDFASSSATLYQFQKSDVTIQTSLKLKIFDIQLLTKLILSPASLKQILFRHFRSSIVERMQFVSCINGPQVHIASFHISQVLIQVLFNDPFKFFVTFLEESSVSDMHDDFKVLFGQAEQICGKLEVGTETVSHSDDILFSNTKQKIIQFYNTSQGMKLLILFQVIFLLISQISSETCPIAQYFQFVNKQIDHPFDIISNPYTNPSTQYLAKVKENLSNKKRVCGLKYLNTNRTEYSLKTFENKDIAVKQGYIVTHQGICGKCSTTKDLYVYLTTDLTRPVRKCGLKYFYSHEKMKKCIKNLGFTDACTQVWYWNTLNTKKHCLEKCLYAYVTNQKFVINDHLNPCLQCDQDISGPIFKYESGRTRRNSGIHSQIDRPDDQIYKMDHCYY